MDSSNEKYAKKLKEIEERLEVPEIKKKVDNYLEKISKLIKCDVELFYDIHPEEDEYSDYLESDKFVLPVAQSITLEQLINYISEEDRSYQVYIDPIFLKKGLNEISDVLTTTVDNKILIIPVNKNEKN